MAKSQRLVAHGDNTLLFTKREKKALTCFAGAITAAVAASLQVEGWRGREEQKPRLKKHGAEVKLF